ncbi:hypothetical protein DFJ73DRAFT_949855 [Zopfochytrium polystomum]|nr:hypothetical protein DFJ73DRAFT_949855 [Zopfochytrium polystomum]
MGAPTFNYSGNCHCGAFCFDLSLAAVSAACADSSSSTSSSSSSSSSLSSPASLPLPLPLYACHCTICTMKACILLPFVPTPSTTASTVTTTQARAGGGSSVLVVAFIVTRGAGDDGLGGGPAMGPLTDFAVPGHRGRHRFCATCGTTVAIVEDDESGGCVRVLALNVRAVRHGRQFVADAVAVGDDSAAPPSLPPAAPLWDLPPLLALDLRAAAAAGERLAPVPQSSSDDDGIESFAAIAADAAAHEGERVYAGGCYCRAVTYRMGSILTYPRPLTRVALHQTHDDALVAYFYALGSKFCGFQFCRFCGVNTCNWVTGPPAEVLAASSEEIRAVVREKVAMKPVNIRTMDFFLGLQGGGGGGEKKKGDQEEEEDRARVLARVERVMFSGWGKAYVVPSL